MFINDINLIKKIDPENPLELNQVTVYLILKNEKEKELYENSINKIKNILESEKCPYNNLCILVLTRDLLAKVGDKSFAAAFQENNVMVRLYNHPITFDYKYMFGSLSLSQGFVDVEFLQFLSDAACENVISLQIYSQYNEDSWKETSKIISHFEPLVEIYKERGANRKFKWDKMNDMFFWDHTLKTKENIERWKEKNRTYIDDINLLPKRLYGRGYEDEIDAEDVVMKFVPGTGVFRIGFEIHVDGQIYPITLKTKSEMLIYMSVLLAKYKKFTLLREHFKHQKETGFFVLNGRRCTGWMRQLYNLVINDNGDFNYVYSQLKGGPSEHHKLNNDVSKINAAIRKSIEDPIIQDICLIKRKGIIEHTIYTIDLLPSNIHFLCPDRVVNGEFISANKDWSDFLKKIESIYVEDEKILPIEYKNDLNKQLLLNLNYPQSKEKEL